MRPVGDEKNLTRPVRRKQIHIFFALVKLRGILAHLRICIFKIFFNHGEGNNEEINQVEGNLVHLRRFILKIFFNHGEGNNEEISQIDGHSRKFSKTYFQIETKNQHDSCIL